MKPYQILIVGAIAVGVLTGTTLATIASRNTSEPIRTAESPSPEPTAESPSPEPTAETPSPEPTTEIPSPEPTAEILTSETPTSEPSTVKPKPTGTTGSQPNKSAFSQFRLRLLDAVSRRDANFIRAIVTPETEWSYGGTLNLERYEIDNKSSLFWSYMEKAVSSGCTIDRQAKVADKELGSAVWVCPDATLTLKSIQPNKSNVGQLAILGENVNVRTEPGTGGKVVGVVSHEFVQFDSETFNSLPLRMQEGIKGDVLNSWTPVKLQNGQQGWILNRYIYDQETDYRVSFVRTRGQWRLRYFLPGNGN